MAKLRGTLWWTFVVWTSAAMAGCAGNNAADGQAEPAEGPGTAERVKDTAGGLVQENFGAKNGLLFYGFDVACVPKQEIQLRGRVQKGTFLDDQTGRTLRFSLDDKVIGEAKTDDEGIGSLAWTPPAVGDYVFTVTLLPKADEEKQEEQQVASVTLVVACRQADVPVAVVDLDRTLVASGFWEVATAEAAAPKAMPGSEDVMKRIARDYFVIYLTHRPDYFIYLTHRPDYFAPKSKGWLKAHGYPQGPVIMSSLSGFMRGSESFKTAALKELGKTFTRLKVGVGDKPGDVKAYHANGMKGILILPDLPRGSERDDYEDLAEELGKLPTGIQVVKSWAGVEDVLFKGASRTPADRIAELRLQAKEAKD